MNEEFELKFSFEFFSETFYIITVKSYLKTKFDFEKRNTCNWELSPFFFYFLFFFAALHITYFPVIIIYKILKL